MSSLTICQQQTINKVYLQWNIRGCFLAIRFLQRKGTLFFWEWKSGSLHTQISDLVGGMIVPLKPRRLIISKLIICAFGFVYPNKSFSIECITQKIRKDWRCNFCLFNGVISKAISNAISKALDISIKTADELFP